MIYHHLIIILRNLWRSKVYSSISIGGLAVGMACFLLVLFYVRFEQSYDDFHRNGDRIYRVVRESTTDTYTERRSNTGPPVAPILLNNFPGIRQVVRFTTFFEGTVGAGEKSFSEHGFIFADNAVFDVFTFPLLRGDPTTALRDPSTVVLTPEMARKYFGDADPIGRVLTLQAGFMKDQAEFTVTGIVQDPPANSHIKFDFLASYASLRSIVGSDFLEHRWECPTWVYVELRPGQSSADLENQFPAVFDKYVDKANFKSVRFTLQPLRDVYYHSIGMGGIFGDFGIQFISVTLLAVAGLVLLIASFNFMNLMTARAPTRSREIGLRKVMGADRLLLAGQFLGESLVSSFLAVVLAVLMVELLLPAFTSLIRDAFPTFGILPPRTIIFGLFSNIPFVLGTGLVVGMLSGIYPAVYLSALQPAEAIRQTGSMGSSALFRKLLVIAQFAAAAVLITSAIIVYSQINYMQHKDLGFEKDFVLTIPINDASVREHVDALKVELLQHSEILGVTAASQVPGVGSQNGILLASGTRRDVDLGIIYVDQDYVRTLGLHMADGRDFSPAISADKDNAILMNETAARLLGWEGAHGQEAQLYFKENGRVVPMYRTKLVGIVRDFNFRDLTTPIQPVILKIAPVRWTTLFVRINPAERTKAMADIEKSWSGFHFRQALQWSYLSDEIAKSFSIIDVLDTLVETGSVLAFVIACLGLFGLALFIMERKTKEIGIRKTLGASVRQLEFMLSRSFVLWVLLGNVIAIPISYSIMNEFLQIFVYRIDVGPGVYLLTGGVTCVLALGTVMVQAIKTSRVNPVDTLRHE